MEKHPSLYMVDCMERKELEMFEGKRNSIQKIKMDCLSLFYFFGVNKKCLVR